VGRKPTESLPGLRGRTAAAEEMHQLQIRQPALAAVDAGLAIRFAIANFIGVGLEGRSFLGELELRASWEVLDVVLQVVGAWQGLPSHINLAAGEGQASASHRQKQGRATGPGKASVLCGKAGHGSGLAGFVPDLFGVSELHTAFGGEPCWQPSPKPSRNLLRGIGRATATA